MFKRLVAMAGLLMVLAGTGAAYAQQRIEALVYKSPTCGCCTEWVKHLQANGFSVKVVDLENLDPIKQKFGVPRQLASCHTAVIGGYVVEGHVPAAAIKRLLKEKPGVIGVSVPGMPIGSPGMEGPNPEPFSAISFDERGRTKVYESWGPTYRW